MSLSEPIFHNALRDFNDARRKAAMQDVLAQLTGKSNELLSYDEVAAKLKLNARSERGVFDIPLSAIVGSVGRYTDFTRTFLPRSTTNQERWARVKAAIDDPASPGWPPIDVYKVGDVYFVLDGNHRVSVARQEGFEKIEAHVIEVKTDISLTPDIQPDDLIIKAEYAQFLEHTDLASLRPGLDLSVSVPGQYDKLKEHLAVHQYYMGIDLKRDVSYHEAVGHWYDEVYLPVVEPIRDRGLLRWFPGRTETDIYLWVAEHRAALESELGWHIRPETAITDLAAKENPKAEDEEAEPGSWRKSRMMDRYTDHLFREILVPVKGSPESWQALEQAILIAGKENADLFGLHIVSGAEKIDDPEALQVQETFNRRCQETSITGNLAIEHGEIASLVCSRALLSDLVVMNMAHPPAEGLASLASGLRTIIWQSARPILTVSGQISPMDNALVAFDGSVRSREALFVAAYLAEKWNTRLTVVSASDSGATSSDTLDYAREYLELHELQADFLQVEGPPEKILDIVDERAINLLLMGGYGGNAWQELFVGSAVNVMLRKAACPILICR
jgi:nucleotide-binding universal stress UspA family protein